MHELSFLQRIHYRRDLRQLEELREMSLKAPDRAQWASDQDFAWLTDEIDLPKTRFLSAEAVRLDIDLPDHSDSESWRPCTAKRDADDLSRQALTAHGRDLIRERIGEAKESIREAAGFWANCIISILSLVVAILALVLQLK